MFTEFDRYAKGLLPMSIFFFYGLNFEKTDIVIKHFIHGTIQIVVKINFSIRVKQSISHGKRLTMNVMDTKLCKTNMYKKDGIYYLLLIHVSYVFKILI